VVLAIAAGAHGAAVGATPVDCDFDVIAGDVEPAAFRADYFAKCRPGLLTLRLGGG
jgi:hypothetical protein